MKRILIVLAIVAIPALASAQTETHRQGASTSDDCARARQAGRACSLVFDTPEEIGGKRVGADFESVTGRSSLSFTSLIKVRESFRDRIIHAAEDL
ncbi:MAG TPA: hypothetical protein VNM90_18305 [Haliangium sp.]|nr:hypothetical protein [Haliangium sp.]